MVIPEGIVVALVAGILGISGGIVTARMARSAQREMYPAEIIADLRIEVAGLRTEVAEVTIRSRVLEDYAHELRDHIAERRDPPPPPWPPGLTT